MNTAPENAGERLPDLNLREMVTPIFRQRRALFGTFCFLMVAVLAIALLWAPHYYVASMQVLVEQTRVDPAISPGQSVPAASRQISLDQVNSEMTLLQGTDMLRKVVDSCALASYDPTFRDRFRSGSADQIRAIKREAAVVQLAGHLKVMVEAGSDVINVKYGRFGEPEVPACVLQNLGQLYLDKHVMLQRPGGSADFFRVETANYRQLLEQAEQKLIDFGRQEGVAAPEILRTDLAQQTATAEAQRTQAFQLLATDTQRIATEKGQMADMPLRAQTTETTLDSNLLLQNLGSDLVNARIRRSQLLLKYEPAYPLVKEVDAEIALTETAIRTAQTTSYTNRTTDRDHVYEYLREDVAKTAADLATQRSLIQALGISIASLQKEMVRMDGLSINKEALERDAKSAEGDYLLYQTKREQARISDELDRKGVANVAIAVPAVVPVLHAYPPTKIVLFGIPLAMLLAFTAAYIAEYLDPSLRTPAEVADALGIPVLAAIPR